MPALVNRSVSSCGIRLEDATGVWPRDAKKSRNAERSSSAVRGGDTGQIVSATSVSPFRRSWVTASKSPCSFPDTGPSFGGAPARLVPRRGSSSRVSSDGPYRRGPTSSSSTPGWCLPWRHASFGAALDLDLRGYEEEEEEEEGGSGTTERPFSSRSSVSR